jgi:hypothetical protein
MVIVAEQDRPKHRPAQKHQTSPSDATQRHLPSEEWPNRESLQFGRGLALGLGAATLFWTVAALLAWYWLP